LSKLLGEPPISEITPHRTISLVFKPSSWMIDIAGDDEPDS
jgi:hypothetical protein